MGEDSNTNSNLIAEILGGLVNNRDGNAYGGNWMWMVFFVFMMMWGGNGNFFGNGFGRNGFGNIATQGDVFGSAAWGQTQDSIRDSIENTTNTVGRLAQDVSAGHSNIIQGINGVTSSINQLGYSQLAQGNATNQAISNLGYNQLAQSNNTNQQLARTGFDLQTAIMAGNNMLQGAIMAGNNMVNNSVRETAADTRLAMCQGNSALQAIMQGVGNNLQMATYQTANDTQRQIQGTGNNLQTAIYQTANGTQRDIQNTGFGIQTGLLQSANGIQRDIQSMNADARLAVCQSTNALQNTNNDNANRTNATIAAIGNNILQGITGLGFLTQQKGDELKFELAKSTCDITSNNTANTQKVLDKLCQMQSDMQASKIQELQTANQALMLSNQVKELQANQLATAGYIINQVNPPARPAWIVSSPYQSITTGTTTTTP